MTASLSAPASNLIARPSLMEAGPGRSIPMSEKVHVSTDRKAGGHSRGGSLSSPLYEDDNIDAR